MASGHIPFLVNGDLYAEVNGKKYIDGGALDFQPVFNENTIRVSPYMDTIWGKTPLILWIGLYGTTGVERNRNMFNDGYHFAKNEDEKPAKPCKNQEAHGIWAPLNQIT